MKEKPIITSHLLDSEAERLAKQGLQRYEVVVKLSEQYGSKAVSEWLELETLLRREQ